jgi:hypothetical protein
MQKEIFHLSMTPTGFKYKTRWNHICHVEESFLASLMFFDKKEDV